jgi:hypothetical protein
MAISVVSAERRTQRTLLLSTGSSHALDEEWAVFAQARMVTFRTIR